MQPATSRSNSSGVPRSWNDGRRDTAGLATAEPLGLVCAIESSDRSGDWAGFAGDRPRVWPESELAVEDPCTPGAETDGDRWESALAPGVVSTWMHGRERLPSERALRAWWVDGCNAGDVGSGRRVYGGSEVCSGLHRC